MKKSLPVITENQNENDSSSASYYSLMRFLRIHNFDFSDVHQEVRMFCRKGLDFRIRSAFWWVMIEAESYQKLHTYQSTLEDSEKNFNRISKFETVILHDISRTFSKHPYFRENHGYGFHTYKVRQGQLYRVLRAYAYYNQDIGYCQGMGFIAAFFLTYFDEENSFWMLVAFIEKLNLHGYLRSDMPMMEPSFYKLLWLCRNFAPKIFEVLKEQEIHPTMFATKCFIAQLAMNLKFDVLARVWDLLLAYGPKVIYRVILAIFKIHEKSFVNASLEEFLERFTTLCFEINETELIKGILEVSISNSLLKALEKEYTENPNKEIMSILRKGFSYE